MSKRTKARWLTSIQKHALSLDYAEALGVNTEKLIISQPDYGEQALEIADQLVSSGEVDLVVVDSVAALIPKAEIEGEIGELKVGLHARIMSQAMRKLAPAVYKSDCTLIFINQIRYKIGGYGNPETTTGGTALKFYSSVRLEVRRSTQVKEGVEVLGNVTKVKVAKNKLASPFKTAEFEIKYGVGVDKVKEIIDLGAQLGVIDKKGSHYYYSETKLGNGSNAVRATLDDNPELLTELEQKINQLLTE